MRLPSSAGQIAFSFGIALAGLILVLLTSRAGWIMLIGGTVFGVFGLLRR